LGSRFGEFHDFQWRSLQDILMQQRLINDKIDLSTAVAFDLVLTFTGNVACPDFRANCD
jgi:hypothetical protein